MARAPRSTDGPVAEVPRKLGRPPKVKAAETRELLIRVARELFAERGFEVTTNKDIADAAAITTGALYYHFPSKRDLYLVAYEDTQRQIYQRFADAMSEASTFVGKFEKLLDCTHALNGEDPSLARFTAAVRIDIRRHREMFEELSRGSSMRESFFEDLVGVGVATGEIAPDRREQVVAVLLAFLIGLNDALSDDQELHWLAIEGVKAVVEGELLRRPGTTRRGAAR
jgi:AcrR family transcriptional regulator